MSSTANKGKLQARRKQRRAKYGDVARVLERVGTIDDVADSLGDAARRAELIKVGRAFVGDLGPIPVSVAAPLLEVSEPTVRTWTKRGLLPQASSGNGLDVLRLYEVFILVRRLRAAGHNRDLLSKVWLTLSDSAVLERDDLKESLEQMRSGQGIPTDVDQLEAELGIAD